MHIVAGPTSVVESGSVTAFNATPLRLIPTGGPAVTLAFVEGEGGAEPSVQVSRGPDGWTFVCHNFADMPGRGSSEPIYLGDLNGWGWYLRFRAILYGNTRDFTVLYTFYAGETAGEPAPVEGEGRSG